MRTIIAAAAVAVMLAGPAGAEPGPLGTWLMNQPVTLWDRGMDRASETAARAGKTSAPLAGSRRWGHAKYHWDNNEIELWLTITGDTGRITHKRCNDIRRGFLRELVYGQLPVRQPAVKELLTIMIDRWFSHSGFARKARDEKLGEKMARIVFVGVRLFGDQRAISCRGRILEFEAASRPIN